ncbi:Zn-ribbon domain-containing OB-fold protein [Phenylobacterium sp.]|jgi:hypothetical protein|uniref:Zn-ribbon domain-containing OB-fold protein n=1 Tax=Phenylobacterium sp. TaxID=1871053 RepID=UPI002F423FB2
MRDDDFFWEGARAGRLLVQKCGNCGLVRHPPAPMCAKCQSLEVDIQECCGRAKVLGWVASKHPNRPDEDPRIVVHLELEEGIKLISNIQGIPLDEIHVGLPVEVFYQEFDGVVLPQFRPAAGVAA